MLKQNEDILKTTRFDVSTIILVEIIIIKSLRTVIQIKINYWKAAKFISRSYKSRHKKIRMNKKIAKEITSNIRPAPCNTTSFVKKC